MKKIIKIILFVFVICSFIVIPQNNVKAVNESAEETSVSGIIKGLRPTSPSQDKYSDLAGVIGIILGFLQIASAVTAVIMIAFLGFELITAMPNTREEIKKKMFPMIIGIMLVFGATSIATFIVRITG